ncbi:hypothetical protein VNO78_07800 [Psophocarpus tetragonolobus]|uniref:AP2/ERF domain-containing protein n=1 Tax=Psophocarpus tetragonolobus TaxID=3891 RepID=A0AAN9XS85_PSOTE
MGHPCGVSERVRIVAWYVVPFKKLYIWPGHSLVELKPEAEANRRTSCGMESLKERESEVSETSSPSMRSQSDEEVILASARPKKRAGRRVFKETRHPVYRGVRRRNNNKWVCEMRVPNNNSRIWLGTYPTPEMAARAHDVAALSLRGKSACLNFADSVWRLTLPATTDLHDIRRAAVHAAESFAPLDHVHPCLQLHQQPQEPLQPHEDQDQDQEWHDFLLSIADEPLMSPPPCARDNRDWNDLDIFDAEVSLWNFSI